ncbi:MAG: type I restriction enzyme endonuclease domain-containing protein [Armatimonadota bacterium]
MICKLFHRHVLFKSVRANLRRLVKRILRECKYALDRREKAAHTVLEQAELWAAA